MKKLSNAASLLLLAIIFGQVQGQAVEYACAQLPKKRPIYAEKTFFSSSSTDVGTLPKYKLGTKPAEKIRTFIQAGTPELDQVRMIASLRGKQREEVIRVYEKGRAELSVMNVDFSELRKKMPPSLIEKMLSKEEPQLDMMTKSEDFELLLKARSLLQKLRSKRLSVWEEIQGKLSAGQLEELDKLKSGELPADSKEQSKN